MNPSTVEELARRVNLAVESYGKVDPEVCLRMASCTLGKERKTERSSNWFLLANNLWTTNTQFYAWAKTYPSNVDGNSTAGQLPQVLID